MLKRPCHPVDNSGKMSHAQTLNVPKDFEITLSPHRYAPVATLSALLGTPSIVLDLA
jgi:hypothetical protein